MASFDRIIEMVNKKNAPPHPLTRNNVSLSNMTVESAPTHNTRVTMRGHGSESGYSGQVDLFYTRVNLSAMGEINIAQEEQFTYEEMLGIINRSKVAQMTADDLTNTGLPPIVNGVVTTFILSAKESSLVWLGNTQINVLTGIPAEADSLFAFLNNEAASLFGTSPN